MPRTLHAIAPHGEFCDPIFPNPKVRLWDGDNKVHLQHRLICCDCGLSHDFEFQIVEVKSRGGKVRMVAVAPKSFAIQFRARRNERSSAAIRRKPHDFVEKKKRK